MRGVAGKGNNLLRSPIAMDDQHGELINARLAKHDPPVNLVQTDGVAVAEYLHGVLATMGAQGSPPGRNPVGLNLNLLVGDAQAGKLISMPTARVAIPSLAISKASAPNMRATPPVCKIPGFPAQPVSGAVDVAAAALEVADAK